MDLHPVGRRGLVISALVFIAAVALRAPGLSSPRSLAFDEFLYVPAAGGYISGIDPGTEPTHPPLFKELTSLVLRAFGGITRTCEGAGCRGPAHVDEPAPRVSDGQFGEVVNDAPDRSVWVTIPKKHLVERISAAGRVIARIHLHGRPRRLAVVIDEQAGNVPHAYRVLVTEDGERAETIDPYKRAVALRLSHFPADLVAGMLPSVLWVSNGRTLSAFESTSLARIGTVQLRERPDALVPRQDQVIAVEGRRGEAFSSGLLPAARMLALLFGALAVALTAALALRATGSPIVALVAAAVLLLDPMQTTLSQLVLPETTIVSFVVAAWFCVLSAMRAAGTRRRLWLAGTAVACAAAVSVKWNGGWPILGIGVLLLWDLRRHGDDAVLRCFGPSVPRVLAVIASMGAVVAAIYLVVFIPNGLSTIVAQHRAMLHHHLGESYTYFEAPWYQWPLGARAFRIWATQAGDAMRSEMWLIPNAVIALAGTVAVVWSWFTRSRAIRIIGLAAAAEVVPWVFVPRATFVYHAAAILPFAAIALASLARIAVRAGWPQRALVAAVAGVAVYATVLTWPLATGASLTQRQLNSRVSQVNLQIRPPQIPWADL